jgi:hypothetical protein
MLTSPAGPTACWIEITETHEGDCVMPADIVQSPLINYTISYGNSITDPNDPNYVGTLSDARVVVYLPWSLDPNAFPDGTYDTTAHAVTWTISSLAPGGSGSRSMSATVNYLAKPGVSVRNTAQLEFDPWAVQDSVDTPICYYGGPVIHVDPNATGLNNGTTWADAFTNLWEAVDSANLYGPGAQVWTKKGLYRVPVAIAPASGVSIYGSFAGWEFSLDQRVLDPNSTVVTGDTDDDWSPETWDLFSLDGVTNVTIEGIAFRMSVRAGISVEYAIGEPDIVIANCIFQNNSDNGLYVDNADPCVTECHFANNGTGIYALDDSSLDVRECSFAGNGTGIDLYDASASISDCDIGSASFTGVECAYAWVEICNTLIHAGYRGIACSNYSPVRVTQCTLTENTSDGVSVSGATLTVDRSLVEMNGASGIYADGYGSLTVTASIIRGNGSHGIQCANNAFAPILTNNWIVNNGTTNGYGVNLDGVGGTARIRNNTICGNGSGGVRRAGTTPDPNILNCIFWGHGANDLVGTFNAVNYSRLSTSHSGSGNITDDPCFADPCNGDYHLQWTSPCMDTGLTVEDCYYECDIEREDRVFDGDGNGTSCVDMGADECYYSPADLDDDDFVNFVDYALFMQNWLATGCNAGNEWCSGADIGHSGSVGWADMHLFAKDWLWGSTNSQLPGATMSMFGDQGQMMMSMLGEDEALCLQLEASGPKAIAVTVEATPGFGLAADELQAVIDFLYEVAKEDPQAATAAGLYDFIKALEQDLAALQQGTATDQ